ncbi:pyochelin biosynthetic protein PchC [Humidesulfovibrio mexicanus]|uniref:Pyochelin biosynthetic protein PchC n=1 Tax=Humidesulfovibrio mexicanus TaxID=147047 RepID=A0A239BMK5_9BACT|nr:alpha/beta fold hydrolase [Humidesulfovibrio mexicanus]SNS08303.1 pyochelin biosynthetic protein PchC [Humidesulfovibrio mexicanus]
MTPMDHHTAPPCLPHMPAEPIRTPRMFCFPFAGSSSEYYRQWQPGLAASVRICPVELPGRASRHGEPLASDMAALVVELAQALLPFTSEPYLFFGHSLGSSVATLVLRELTRRGAPPPRLFFASGRFPIHLPHGGRTCHTLDDQALIEEIRRLGGTPEEVLTDPIFTRFFLPIVRADFRLLETFAPPEPEPLDAPIEVFGGVQDEDSPPWAMERWADWTSAGCRVRLFHGGHFFIDQNREGVLAAIKDRTHAMCAATSDTLPGRTTARPAETKA